MFKCFCWGSRDRLGIIKEKNWQGGGGDNTIRLFIVRIFIFRRRRYPGDIREDKKQKAIPKNLL